MMRPHPPRGRSHHTTHDHLIEIDGEEARIDAQFVVFRTLGAEKPAGGWPSDEMFALQGTIIPIESGYYRPSLCRVDGNWLIESMQIIHALPMASGDAGVKAIVYRRYGGPHVVHETPLRPNRCFARRKSGVVKPSVKRL
jgi:hypothetical protein